MGDVELIVLLRCMQAEATRSKWRSKNRERNNGNRNDDENKDNGDDQFLCDNLCAIVSNLSSKCVHLHASVANRLIHLVRVLTRRLSWAARR